MKKIAYIIGLAICLVQIASAQNYFQPGTVWEGYSAPLSEGPGAGKWKATLLETVDFNGEQAMPFVYVNTETEETGVPRFYVRTEEEKVFWRATEISDSELDQWYLMYDFGLQPGETASVTNPYFDETGLASVETVEVECVARDISLEGKIGTFMELKYASNENATSNHEDNYWILGAGSILDPEMPATFGLTGLSTSVSKVTTADGKVVFGYRSEIPVVNYFQPGTVWEGLVMDLQQGPDLPSWSSKLLDPITVDGEEVMPYVNIVSSNGDVSDPKLYVKSEGNKVYWTAVGDTNGAPREWYLMYDFGLQPGDVVEVYSPYENGSLKTEMECIETGVTRPEFEGLADYVGVMMKVAVINQGERGEEGYWVLGGGCIQDPVEPDSFALIGGGLALSKITLADGTVVYGPKNSKVSDLLADSFSVTTDGLTIEVTGVAADEPFSVYSLDGTKAADGIGPCRLTLPEKNVYIVKAGSSTRKITF